MRILNYNNPKITILSSAVYSGYLLFSSNYSVRDLLQMCLISAPIFTLGEYLIHRAIFHHFPYIKNLHQYHHKKPLCEKALHVPVVPTLTFTVLVTESLRLTPYFNLLSKSVYIFFPLWLFLFEVCHRSSHKYTSVDSMIPKKCRKFHQHHHQKPDRNFGFTTTFWDYLFGTLDERDSFRLRLPFPLLDFYFL